MSACALTTRQHHSPNTVTVYHGTPDPVTLCAYHAAQLGPDTFRELDEIREAGRKRVGHRVPRMGRP